MVVWAVFSGMAVVSAISMRMVGFALVVSGLASVVLCRTKVPRVKTLLVLGLVVFLPLGSWAVRCLRVGAIGTAANYIYVNPYIPEQGRASLGDLPARILRDFQLANGGMLSNQLGWRGYRLSTSIWSNLLLVPFWLGLLWHLAARRHPLDLYVAVFLAAIILYPMDEQARLLFPLLPFIAYYYWEAIKRVARTVSRLTIAGQALTWVPTFVRGGGLAVAGALGIAGLVLIVQQIGEEHRPPAWGGMKKMPIAVGEAMFWLKQNVPTNGTIVCAGLGRQVWITEVSGCRGCGYPCTSDRAAVLNYLLDMDVRYVLWESDSYGTSGYLEDSLKEGAVRLETVFENKEFKVDRILWKPSLPPRRQGS